MLTASKPSHHPFTRRSPRRENRVKRDFSGKPDRVSDFDSANRNCVKSSDFANYDSALVKVVGLWYFRARYYNANQGRFIGRDPLGYVDGLGLYGAYYVPTGLDWSGTFRVLVGRKPPPGEIFKVKLQSFDLMDNKVTHSLFDEVIWGPEDASICEEDGTGTPCKSGGPRFKKYLFKAAVTLKADYTVHVWAKYELWWYFYGNDPVYGLELTWVHVFGDVEGKLEVKAEPQLEYLGAVVVCCSCTDDPDPIKKAGYVADVLNSRDWKSLLKAQIDYIDSSYWKALEAAANASL